MQTAGRRIGIRPVVSIWLIGLPTVILAHHRVTQGDGAWITRVWIKMAIALLLGADPRRASPNASIMRSPVGRRSASGFDRNRDHP